MAKKNLKSIIISAALVVISAACVIGILKISSEYPGQTEYERWRGDNEMEFSQFTCLPAESDNLGISSINTFRSALVDGFKGASLDTENNLFTDCYSAEGSCVIVSEKANTKASVTAYGGDFFAFHPLEFTTGIPTGESNTLLDTVVLDEELAWFLFGATDVKGMSVNIDGEVFYISGVVKRESDFASKKAYTGGMGLYMPFSSYASLHDNDVPVTCYELALPNPVKNFAKNLIEEKFPVKECLTVENSGRFSFARLLDVVRNSSSRDMSANVPYPYFENAARYAEAVCAKLLFVAVLALVYPFVTLVSLLISLLSKGKRKLSDDYIPAWKEESEEKIRVRQRKRWEKKHPGQK